VAGGFARRRSRLVSDMAHDSYIAELRLREEKGERLYTWVESQNYPEFTAISGTCREFNFAHRRGERIVHSGALSLTARQHVRKRRVACAIKGQGARKLKASRVQIISRCSQSSRVVAYMCGMLGVQCGRVVGVTRRDGGSVKECG
jgi:hypothetical protein